MTPSAHLDSFARDNLPPRAQWPDFLFGLPELNYPDRINCAVELLDRRIEAGDGARPCLISPSEILSYAQLAERVNRIANVLTRDLGMVPGHRVLLRGPNSPMMVAAYLAVIKAGGGGGGERVVYWDSDGAEPLEVLMAKPGYERFAACDTASDDVCLIGFTSGTTGEPKGTMHFHRDMLAICDSYAKHVLQAEPTDRFTGSPPLAFTFGLGGLVLFPLRIGASTVLLDQAGPDQVLDAIGKYKITIPVTAPTAYRAILGKLKDYDISSLRKCVSAGETLP